MGFPNPTCRNSIKTVVGTCNSPTLDQAVFWQQSQQTKKIPRAYAREKTVTQRSVEIVVSERLFPELCHLKMDACQRM